MASDWLAATALPPTANTQQCDCMIGSLCCATSGNILDQSLFQQVCGQEQHVCDGVSANAMTGQYSAYSMCNATNQLSWAFNKFYEHANSDSQ